MPIFSKRDDEHPDYAAFCSEAHARLDELDVPTSETETSPHYSLVERINWLASENDSLLRSIAVRTKQRDEAEAKWEGIRSDYSKHVDILLEVARALDAAGVPNGGDDPDGPWTLAMRVEWLNQAHGALSRQLAETQTHAGNMDEAWAEATMRENALIKDLGDAIRRITELEAKLAATTGDRDQIVSYLASVLDHLHIPPIVPNGDAALPIDQIDLLVGQIQDLRSDRDGYLDKLAHAEIDNDELRNKLLAAQERAEACDRVATAYREIIERYHKCLASLAAAADSGIASGYGLQAESVREIIGRYATVTISVSPKDPRRPES